VSCYFLILRHFFSERKSHLFSVFVAMLGVCTPGVGKANEVFLSYTVGYLRIATAYENYSALLPVGATLEYMRAVTQKFGVYAMAEANLELEKKTLVLSGGGVGATFSLFGGPFVRMESDDIKLTATPWAHMFLFVGVSQYSYDVTSIVPPPQQLASGVRRRVERVGTFITPVVGLGWNVYTSADAFHTLGVRALAKQSLNLDKLALTSLSGSLAYGFAF
jgi:hypothetical protein